MTWFGVRPGRFSSISAATPDTTAVDIDVPLSRKYARPTTHLRQSFSKSLPMASVDTSRRPGASTSGLRDAVLGHAAARPGGEDVVVAAPRAAVVDATDA